MFFKSCNCNSSIATRVGFAVSMTPTPLSIQVDGHIDDICAEFHACMDDEDVVHDTSDREMELRLHQDGL